jgi:hypothetical protein
MPKFLTGCHYNEVAISRHLKKNTGYWPVQMNWQQVCNRSNPEKTGRSCKGPEFSWLSSKVFRTRGFGLQSMVSQEYLCRNMEGVV